MTGKITDNPSNNDKNLEQGQQSQGRYRIVLKDELTEDAEKTVVAERVDVPHKSSKSTARESFKGTYKDPANVSNSAEEEREVAEPSREGEKKDKPLQSSIIVSQELLASSNTTLKENSGTTPKTDAGDPKKATTVSSAEVSIALKAADLISSKTTPTRRKKSSDQPDEGTQVDYLTQIALGNEQFAHIRRNLPSLGRSIGLGEGEFPKGSRLNVFAISAMVIGFVVWAAITPIKEIAVAQGQIIPSSFVKTIQHLEGGIVKNILVEDGSDVREGDVLLRMDEASAVSELDQLRARETGLRIRAERLRAFGMNQTPDFKQFGAEFQSLVDDQVAIYDMQTKNREDQKGVIQKQIEQRKATLAVQEGRVKDLEHRVSVLEKQRDVLKGLYDKRLKTGTEYRGAEDTLAEVLVELNQAKNSALETQQTIGESESRILELNTRLRNESLIEMGNVTAEIAQLTESKIKLQDRVKRLEIRAPSAGIVKGLKNTTLQGVIQPGAEILQIVPKDNLEVEAKVQPKDMGKLRAGQKVLVKVTAFDYARYGGIQGEVKSVSATTFMDEKNAPYYRVFIKLSQKYIGKDPKAHEITPGMTVQADIETDEKTLLQYLVKPVYIALHESFGEK